MSILVAVLLGMAALSVFAMPAVPTVLAQDFVARQRSLAAHSIIALYDRITDSTRVTVPLGESARRFGLGSKVWAYAYVAFRGRRLPEPASDVVLAFESWTPARGGWAFAHAEALEVRSGRLRLADVPAAEYVKRRVRLFDSGRREALSFRVPLTELAALAEHPGLILKVGRATVRLDQRRMARVRALVDRMRPAAVESR
jgi:hypothetical protein